MTTHILLLVHKEREKKSTIPFLWNLKKKHPFFFISTFPQQELGFLELGVEKEKEQKNRQTTTKYITQRNPRLWCLPSCLGLHATSTEYGREDVIDYLLTGNEDIINEKMMKGGKKGMPWVVFDVDQQTSRSGPLQQQHFVLSFSAHSLCTQCPHT